MTLNSVGAGPCRGGHTPHNCGGARPLRGPGMMAIRALRKMIFTEDKTRDSGEIGNDDLRLIVQM